MPCPSLREGQCSILCTEIDDGKSRFLDFVPDEVAVSGASAVWRASGSSLRLDRSAGRVEVEAASAPLFAGQCRPPSGADQRRRCVVRAHVAGTVKGRDTRDGAASVTKNECQLVGSPRVAALAMRRGPLVAWRFSAFQSRGDGRSQIADGSPALAMRWRSCADGVARFDGRISC